MYGEASLLSIVLINYQYFPLDFISINNVKYKNNVQFVAERNYNF